MRFTGLVFLFVNIYAFTNAAEEDATCKLTPPTEPKEEPECCELPFKLDNSEKASMKEMMVSCMKENGMEKPGPPSGGSPPVPPHMNPAHDCVDECLFKKNNLLTDAMEMKKDDVKKFLIQKFTGEWTSVSSAAFDKCFESAKSKVDDSSKCKSGAKQVMKCMERELFINCPTASWTDSESCKSIKERLVKCPNHMPPPSKHMH